MGPDNGAAEFYAHAACLAADSSIRRLAGICRQARLRWNSLPSRFRRCTVNRMRTPPGRRGVSSRRNASAPRSSRMQQQLPGPKSREALQSSRTRPIFRSARGGVTGMPAPTLHSNGVYGAGGRVCEQDDSATAELSGHARYTALRKHAAGAAAGPAASFVCATASL